MTDRFSPTPPEAVKNKEKALKFQADTLVEITSKLSTNSLVSRRGMRAFGLPDTPKDTPIDLKGKTGFSYSHTGRVESVTFHQSAPELPQPREKQL